MNRILRQLWAVAVLGGACGFGAGGRSALAASPSGEAAAALSVDRLVPLASVPLVPNDGAGGDYFGNSVSLSGDGNTALVGAPFHTFGTQLHQGCAYIFVRSGSSWMQLAELMASDGAREDYFGYSVALSADGNTALVGAMSSGTQESQGRGYVFVHSGSNWVQQAVLMGRDGAARDGFGSSVALSGDGTVALVGAPFNTLVGQASQGSAYVFVRSDSSWSQQAELLASDGAGGDEFGGAVALSSDGTTALIGAYHKTVGTQAQQGSAYVFVRNGSGWHQQTALTAGDGTAHAAFGSAVALSSDGSTALVGAETQPVNAEVAPGSAYVFVRGSHSWTQQAALSPSDGASNDLFGSSVALSGDGHTALVGTVRLRDYVFVRAGSSWTQQAELTSGSAVSLSSDANTALVGDANAQGQGRAYILGTTLSITVSAAPANAGIVSGGGTFAAGSAQLVTALANPGFAFTNWTENGVAVSTAPNYSFTLESDRTLVANFLTVPITNVTPAKGTYRGLFSAGDAPAQRSSGNFTLTTSAQGTMSAAFIVGGTRYASRGAFDSFGCCTQTLRSAKGPSISVQLQLSAADPDQLYGTISATDGSWSAALAGDRATYHRVTNTAPQAGKYTLVIPGSPGMTNLPGGDGYGTLKVDAGGKITLNGSLADGTSISHASALSKTGEWPLYVRLHSGKGSLQGWVIFATTPTNDLSGTLAWIKPVLPKAKYYPTGFSVQTLAPGFRYIPPRKGEPILNWNQAVLVLSGDGLTQNLTNYMTVNANNRVTSTNKLKMSFTASTGAFRGNVPTTAGGKNGTIPFRGVLLQSTNSGQGYFLGGAGQTGEVTFGAP